MMQTKTARLAVAKAALAMALFVSSTSCWRNIIYQPTSLTSEEVAQLGRVPGWKTDTVHTEVPLVGLVHRPSASHRPWLLFFGGNAMDLSMSQSVLMPLAAEDFGLAVWAYRGYDSSGGSPSEAALHSDAMALAHHLLQAEGLTADQLFIMGQSLGTGVATPLAGKLASQGLTPAGLVLLSPFTSMAEVIDDHAGPLSVGWSLEDKFDSGAAAKEVKSPILIIHGEQDTLIRPAHSERLVNAWKQQVELIKLPEREHNDLWHDPVTVGAITSFINTHRKK